MKSNLWRVLAGLLIMLVGIVLLASQLGWVTLTGDFWGVVFLLGGGVIFLALWLSNRTQWWPLIPGGVMGAWGVATLLGMLGLSETLTALVGMVGSATPFLVIYGLDRKANWWALIPAGVLAVVGFGVGPLGSSAWFVFPALLILAGVLLIVRTLLKRG
jgi:hypothetical protein